MNGNRSRHLGWKSGLYALAALLLLLTAWPSGPGLLKPGVAHAGPNDVPLPPPTEWTAPSGAPTAPGDDYGITFASPAVTVAPNAPAIAEWTKTVKPNETFTLSGVRFTQQTGAAAGSDTTVWLWAATSTGGVLTKAQLVTVSDTVLQAIVPASVPFGMYLVWVENGTGPSSPIALNRPEPGWMGPFGNTAAPGSTKRLFGKNLSKNHGTANSYVYLQPAAGGAFTAAAVTSVEPYAVAFTVPAGLAAGSYKVYLHSGQGGAYGWSSPLTLNVAAAWTRGTTETIVAPAGGGADDAPAIQAAIDAQTANANGGTVRLQAGTYTLKNEIDLKDNVRLLGAGKTATVLNIDHTNMKPTGILIIGQHTTLQDFKLVQKAGSNQPQYGPIKTNFPGPYADIRLLNLIISADANTKGGTVDIRTSGGEISGSDFYRELTLSGSDFWVHDNNFYGGPYGGANVAETEAATYTDGNNLLMEHNHFETQNWPTDANGSKNYLNFVNPNDLQYKVWAKRVFYSAPQFGSVENSYIAWNTGTDVAVDDNRGELILFHGIPSKVYAQVASSAGTTLTIRTDGKIDGQARNVDNMPAISSVPDNIVHGQLDNQAYVVIMNGTGMGQARKIVSHTSTTVTVDKPWRVQPAADSKITLTYLSKDHIVYNNNINAFPAGYDLFYSASTGPDADGNAWGFAAEGNMTNRTYGGRVLGGYSTGPGYWNEQRDETANNAVHSGMNLVAWAFEGYDFLGPSVLGSYFRGGSANVTSAQNGAASGPPALLNTQISPYEGQEIAAGRNAIVGSGFEGVTGSGSTLGARAEQWTQVLFRNNNVSVQANPNVSYAARPFEIRKDSDPYLISNSYAGGSSVYVKTNVSTLGDRPTPLLRVAQFQGAVGSSLGSISIPVANTGISPMTWTASASQSWITATVGTGASPLAAEQPTGTLDVSVNTSGMAQGTYNGTVTITTGSGRTATVGVKLILGNGSGGGDTQAPAAPTGLTSPSKTSSSVSLSWTASTDNVGVTGYDIYRGTTLAGSVNGTTTSFTDTGLAASTAYTYTVKAKDAAANVSAASNAVTVTTDAPAGGGTGTGLTGEYYNNIDFVGLRNTRVDPTINFDWGTSIPTGIDLDAADTYSVRWTGQIEAPATGTYTFTTTSDDGVKLWVNGTMVIDHYGDHAASDRSGTISLTAGTKYTIKIEYYNNQPGAVMKLYWEYPGQAKQIVPQSRLYP
ncbi:PA14 domain-containing protein [Cohnella sp. 56]|uniref:PA14 domain-containing protein n=1 Tax=Cohnella sp. 56 TaxID=3113722 RepID=UPI0030EAB186